LDFAGAVARSVKQAGGYWNGDQRRPVGRAALEGFNLLIVTMELSSLGKTVGMYVCIYDNMQTKSRLLLRASLSSHECPSAGRTQYM